MPVGLQILASTVCRISVGHSLFLLRANKIMVLLLSLGTAVPTWRRKTTFLVGCIYLRLKWSQSELRKIATPACCGHIGTCCLTLLNMETKQKKKVPDCTKYFPPNKALLGVKLQRRKLRTVGASAQNENFWNLYCWFKTVNNLIVLINCCKFGCSW